MYKIVVLILILMTSCIKEERALSELVYVNHSTKKIELKIYRDAIIIDSFFISPNSQNIKESHYARGKSKKGIIFYAFLRNSDSTTIIFNDSFKITHLYDSITINSKRIGYFSNRSIYGNNYVESIFEEKKHFIHHKVTFTFTEQDYLDAKQ